MGASMRPEPESARRERIRRNLATLKAANAPQEDVDEYLASEQVTPEQELARTSRTAMENVRGGLGTALQGATLNFSDEIVGAARGVLSPSMTMREGIADERQQLQGFREANPKTAFALEMAGGIAPAVATMGAGTAAAQSARPLMNLAKLAGTEGAVAGAGAGEGMQGRLLGGVAGGTLGGLLGVGIGKVATSRAGDAIANTTRRFSDLVAGPSGGGNLPISPATIQTPNVQRTAARMITPALQGASPDLSGARRSLMDYIEGGMGDEVLGMNVGGDRAARTARVFANAPMSDAGQVLNDALARQGGALGRGVAQDIGVAARVGNEPGPIALQRMQRELSAQTTPIYDSFRAIPNVPLDPSDEAQRMFIERYVQPVIQNRRLTGQLPDESALSGDVVNEAFMNLQRDVRGAETAVSMGQRNAGEAGNIKAMRDRVIAAIGETDPAYAQVRNTYALDEDAGKVVQDAYAEGLGMRKAPVGTFTVASSETTDAGREAMRRGLATAYQQGSQDIAPNAGFDDLTKFRDVARGVVGSENDAARFREAFGEDAYNVLMSRLSPKVRAAAMNAAVRGNSTTTRQLLDAISLGDQAVLDVLESGTRGGFGAAAMNAGMRMFEPARAAVTGRFGEAATEGAKMLTARGAPQVSSMLDLLERVSREDAQRRAGLAPLSGTLSRTLAPRVP